VDALAGLSARQVATAKYKLMCLARADALERTNLTRPIVARLRDLVASLCREYPERRVSVTSIYRWRQDYSRGGARALADWTGRPAGKFAAVDSLPTEPPGELSARDLILRGLSLVRIGVDRLPETGNPHPVDADGVDNGTAGRILGSITQG